MYIREVECNIVSVGTMDYMFKYAAFVNTVANIQVPQKKKIVKRGQTSHHHHNYHNYNRFDSPTWALAFLRSFYQLKYPAIASSDFVTRVFSRVGL
jgi:hypothetical protein